MTGNLKSFSFPASSVLFSQHGAAQIAPHGHRPSSQKCLWLPAWVFSGLVGWKELI